MVVWAVVLLLAQPVLAAPPSHAEIDPRILAELASAPTAHLLVRIKDLPVPSAAGSTGRTLPDAATRQVDRRIQLVAQSQHNLQADLTAKGIPFRSYWIVNIVALAADRAEIERLAARPDVLALESDRVFKVPLEPTTPQPLSPAAAASIEPGLMQIHAPDLWALGIKGQGIVVASADTGVTWDHPALESHYRGWDGSQADHNYSWWDAIHTSISGLPNPCGYNLQVPCDDYSVSHGTHTTGTMVGDDGQGNQIGVAPDAKWIACRNMDNGVGRPSTYIECLQFFIAPTDLNGKNPDPSKRPDVINNSYDCPPSELCQSDSLQAAVLAVREAGIFMSVSAGNAGPSCASITNPPGSEVGVFTVGAVDGSNQIASFSSRGPVSVNGTDHLKPDLVAPGVSVRSSVKPDRYAYLSGTSMAAPHVAGAVALLWSAFPALKNDIPATENLLRLTAERLPVQETCGGLTAGTVPNDTTGWGLINLLSAYHWMQNPHIYFPFVTR